MQTYPKMNLLVAYPYFSNGIHERLKKLDKDEYRLIIDSGAFTAWSIGKPIELDDYCKFLDSIADLHPFKPVQLDVIGDPEASYKNLLIMKERGYDPMPVFTRGGTPEELEQLYDIDDYVMLGGIVSGAGNREWLKWAMEHVGDRKCHWLGFINVPFMRHFAPTSVDSSSWQGAGRFGNLSIYTGGGRMKVIGKPKFMQKPDEKLLKLLLKGGFTWDQIKLLGKKEAWINNGKNPGTFDPEHENGIKGTAQYMNTISHIFRAMAVEMNIGTHIYMAFGNKNDIDYIQNARKYIIDNNLLKARE